MVMVVLKSPLATYPLTRAVGCAARDSSRCKQLVSAVSVHQLYAQNVLKSAHWCMHAALWAKPYLLDSSSIVIRSLKQGPSADSAHQRCRLDTLG